MVIVIPMTVGKTDQIRRLERRMALKLRPKLRREGREAGDPVAVQGIDPDHFLSHSETWFLLLGLRAQKATACGL